VTRARPLRNDLVDAVVLEVHGLVHDQGWLADRALERALRRERALWAGERRAAAEAVYGVTRWQGQLDLLLGAGEGGAGSPDLATRYAAWLARFGGVPRDAAARRLGVPPRRLAPLDGADDRLARIRDPLERLAARESLPRWIAERFAAELGAEGAPRLAAAMNARAPLTVRANALHGDRADLAARLRAEGVEAKETPHSPWGLVLDGHANAFALRAFKEGRFEIQDEGSQLIALACGARPGMTVVDACAGAGGKSLALAAEMHGKGSLHALDADAGRLEDARKRARRAGVHNLRARAIAAGGEAEGQLADLEGKADVVLVDAPCSGLGTLRRKPDARWRLAPEDPARFATIQRTLCRRFARLLRPGGRLVYATCAIGRTENGEVAAFVARELGLAPFPLARTLGEERARALGAEGHLLQLYPHVHGTDGFFVAGFTRAGPGSPPSP
jgi:16S rRNA (cytosine967-C5)-methyltransferase